MKALLWNSPTNQPHPRASARRALWVKLGPAPKGSLALAPSRSKIVTEAKLAEPVDYIAETRATYDSLGYPPYQWVKSEDPPPWTPVKTRLEEASVALIASGGIYQRGQHAFHFKDDASYRVIDTSVSCDDLRVTHFAYDVSDARTDPNVVFPLDTLRSLVAEKSLGAITPQAFTFMGGIYSARKVREELAPALVQRVADQRPDIALLVPV